MSFFRNELQTLGQGELRYWYTLIPKPMLSTRRSNACDYFFVTLPQMAASHPVLTETFSRQRLSQKSNDIGFEAQEIFERRLKHSQRIELHQWRKSQTFWQRWQNHRAHLDPTTNSLSPPLSSLGGRSGRKWRGCQVAPKRI